MITITRFIPVGKTIPMKLPDGRAATITRRPGTPMDWDTITVHNTANPSSTPQNELAWLTNQNNTRSASWHYCIRHDCITQAIPDNEVAHHAGTYKGNTTSLSLEIAESGRFEDTLKVAAKWLAEKLLSKGLGTEALRMHQDWSGKYCPRLLITRWKEFTAMVQDEIDELNKPDLPKWKEDIIREAHELGIINDLHKWLEEADEPTPAWAVIAMILQSKKGDAL